MANLALRECTDHHLESQCMEKDLAVQASPVDQMAQWADLETSADHKVASIKERATSVAPDLQPLEWFKLQVVHG